MTSQYITSVRGVSVLGDWDNFFANKMADYYTVKEELDGEWFIVDKAVVSVESEDSTPVLAAIASTKLPLIMRSFKQDFVLIGVIVGPGLKGNPYNLTNKKLYIVDIFDRVTGMFYTPQQLTAFTTKISINPYGSKFLPGPIVGLVDFKAAVKAVKDLQEAAPEGEIVDTSDIENQVLSSLNMLLETPSVVNSEQVKKGLLFAGLFGYTFNYN